jgi:hypothetical protein
MEPWGIYMTVFTLLGMLMLVVASVQMDDGLSQGSQEAPESKSDVEIKKAA